MNELHATKAWSEGSPKEWKVDRIKDCLTSVVGGDWGEEPYSETEGEDLAVLRVADFENGSVTQTDLTIRKIKSSKIRHRLVSDRSLLLEKSGGGEKQWVGRVVYPGRLATSAICSNFIAKLEISPVCEPDFMNYLFAALYDSGANRPHVRQTTGIQNLAVNHYLGVNISLPPLPEQKRIAAYLDASCTVIDSAVGTKQKQLETLDALRKSIIQKAVTQGLNPDVEMKDSGVNVPIRIPFDWRTKRLKALSDIRYGLGQPPAQKDDGLPILRATNVMRGAISEAGLMYVDPDDLPQGRDPYLKTGEIIVVRSGAYTADSAIIPEEWDGSVAGYDLVVTARGTEPRFLAYALLSDYVLKDQLILMTLRAAQPHLNANELGSVKIAVPATIQKQKAICDFLDERLYELKSVRANIESQITILTNYRKSLIHECVTGKRRITDVDVANVEAHV